MGFVVLASFVTYAGWVCPNTYQLDIHDLPYNVYSDFRYVYISGKPLMPML